MENFEYTPKKRFCVVEKPVIERVGNEEIPFLVHERELDKAAIVSCSRFEFFRDFYESLQPESDIDPDPTPTPPSEGMLLSNYLGVQVHQAMMFLKLFEHMETNYYKQELHPESYALYQGKDERRVFSYLVWHAVKQIGGQHGLRRALTRAELAQQAWVLHQNFQVKIPPKNHPTIAQSRVFLHGEREKIWKKATRQLQNKQLFQNFEIVAENDTGEEFDHLFETACNLYFRFKKKDLQTGLDFLPPEWELSNLYNSESEEDIDPALMSWVTPDRVSVMKMHNHAFTLVYDYKCGNTIKSKENLDEYSKLQVLLLALAGAKLSQKFLLGKRRHSQPLDHPPFFSVRFDEIPALIQNVRVIYQKPLERNGANFKEINVTLTVEEITAAVQLLKSIIIYLADPYHRATFYRFIRQKTSLKEDLNPKQQFRPEVSFQPILGEVGQLW